MLFCSTAFVTFFILQQYLTIAQYGGLPGAPAPPAPPPQNAPSGSFAGFWTALGSGGCSGCGGGCGGCGAGSPVNIVNNINVNYPSPVDPVTASTPSTTTTATSYCQVSVNYGPFRPSVCGVQFFLAASIYGYCEPGRLSFQLSGLPCAYVQNDGTVVFDPQGLGCSFGSGIAYYGNLLVTDNWTGQQLANSQIMVDTTGMAYCGGTPPPPPCSVSYFIPNGGIYYATECNQVILSPPQISNCGDGQVRYELSGAIYCLDMFASNGSVVINLSPEHDFMGGCRVGPFGYNYGTVTAFDAYTGIVIGGPWTIVVDLTRLEFCRSSTAITATTTETTTTDWSMTT